MHWKLGALFVFALAALAQNGKLPEDAYPQPQRIVAVGDVHGDFNNFTQVLRDAGLVNKRNKWIGGKSHLVQTGDVVDRGPDSKKILSLLIELEKQAAKAGGRVHALLGNHETMNIYGDVRYVSAQEFASWKLPESAEIRDNYFRQFFLPQQKDAGIAESQLRAAFDEDHPLGWVEHRFGFGPNGDVGRWLRAHNTIVKVGDTVFLHGGISPKYASMPRADINRAVQAALDVPESLFTSVVTDPEGPLWYRGLAFGPEAPLADHLDAVLRFHGARRVVVGHTTVMPAILPRFDGKVIVIDCGLSRVYTGTPAALVIEHGKTFALHRGKLLALPESNAGVMDYLKRAAALDPQPSPILRALEGALPVSDQEDPSAVQKK